ncbi:MAG: peptidyl-prolyl cis-trans isomerase [Deltaproteobacteria bacterium]
MTRLRRLAPWPLAPWPLALWPLALALTVVAGCDGCFGAAPPPPVEEEPGDRSSDPELTLGLPPEVAQRVVAVVDGEPIRVLDVAYELDQSSSMVAALAADASRRRALAQSLVLDRALAAEARDRGLGEDPRVLGAREEALVRAVVAEVERDVAPPSDEQVRAYYEAHRDTYRAPALRSADLIFTRDAEGGRAALAAIVPHVRRQGEDWIPTAERIGFAGPRRQPRVLTDAIAAHAREGELFVPQPVRDAIFATEIGAVHPALVPFEDGFYMVRVVGGVEPSDVPLEAVRENIRALLHAEAIDARVTALVAEALAAASIDDEALESVELPAESPET